MPQAIQIALHIPGTSPLQEVVTRLQQVEAAGFDGAGILASQLLYRDGFVTMAPGAEVNHLYLMPFQTFTPPQQEIVAFRDAVFPRLQAAGYRPAFAG